MNEFKKRYRVMTEKSKADKLNRDNQIIQP